MIKKSRRSRNPSSPDRPRFKGRRQSFGDATENDPEELDVEFDRVDIDDVVRQARNGRIEVAELDAW